jgi:hypothetical protein
MGKNQIFPCASRSPACRRAGLRFLGSPELTVYAIIDVRSSPNHPLSDAIETFIRREDAERFIEEVRGDDAERASYPRIEARELQTGGTRRRSRGRRTYPRPSHGA